VKRLESNIFRIGGEKDFLETAMEVFRFQAKENPVYREYIEHLGVFPENVGTLNDIPFLPIRFFRDREVITGNLPANLVFESSGTTGQVPSRHVIVKPELYEQSFSLTFNRYYGDPEALCILALLPSYLERQHSSLVYMMDHLIKKSHHDDSGFYLDDMKRLSQVLSRRSADGHPTLLIGVSFALLDLAESFPVQLGKNVIVMETGGMKGRRKEMVREELHEQLQQAFGTSQLHSEYGMTELLSQAYSKGKGIFRSPPWMRVLIRDSYDPLTFQRVGQPGGINIIDLANLYSCAFVETSDLGVVNSDNSFDVRGRFDHSEIRGCNLMVH